MRKSPPFTLEECPGQSAKLAAIQAAARPALADLLANTLQGLVDSGALIVVNGRMIPRAKG